MSCSVSGSRYLVHVDQQEIMEGVLEHGPLYSLADYSRALTLLAHSETKGEGPADREEANKRLEQQIEQLEDIFSGDTV